MRNWTAWKYKVSALLWAVVDAMSVVGDLKKPNTPGEGASPDVNKAGYGEL